MRTHQEQLSAHRASLLNNLQLVWQKAHDYKRKLSDASLAHVQTAPSQPATLPAAPAATAPAAKPAARRVRL